MATLTVRLDKETRQVLRELAAPAGAAMPTMLNKTIAEYRRKRCLEGLSED